MADVVMIRTSERMSFKRCRWAWDRGFNDCIKPKTPKPALRFGTLMHKALEKFYRPGLKRGPRPATTFERLYEEELAEQARFGYRDEDGTWQDAGEMGAAMLKHYYETYGKDDRYFVIATEQPFEVVTEDADGVPFIYVGVVDGIWRDRQTKKLIMPDHKSTSSDPTKGLDQLALDEQSGSYWTYGVEWLMAQRILGRRQKLHGILFNYLRKAVPDDRPVNEEGQALNGDGTVSKRQPAPYFYRYLDIRDERDREHLRERVAEEAREMRMVREGELTAYKNPGPMYLPNCRGCDYRDICELHETGSDWEAMRDATMVEWDPYAEHELYERR